MPLTAPRVVVADDAALLRRVVANTLKDAGFEVVGQAADGDEALGLCRSLAPDAMTLDLAMPGTDGMAVLRDLATNSRPVPTVVVSAFSPRHGARAVDALAEGAFELVVKPAGPRGFEAFGTELARKVRAASESRRLARRPRPAPRIPAPPARPVAAVRRGTGERLLVIACSTGGPKALAQLVPALPARVGAGALIVQHMPPGFTASLAARLDAASPLHVEEAAPGASLAPGTALLAPGGRHLRLDGDRRPYLTEEAEIGGLRPRADLTIVDAARLWRDRVVLVVLTGMGRDGLEGAEAVRRHGGRILVEAESTCTVYGMPRAIAEAGLADAVLPLEQLPSAIAEEMSA